MNGNHDVFIMDRSVASEIGRTNLSHALFFQTKESRMHKILSMMLCVGLLYAAFASNGTTDHVISPASRLDNIQSHITHRTSTTPPSYTPSLRQGGVLFVEDLNTTGFGPGVSPDPLWDSTLTHLLGAGNYGWFGPTTDPTQDGPDLTTMQGYDLVIWCTYDYWQSPSALTSNDQTNIASYLAGGGKVWLIGQDLIYTGVPLAWLTTNFHLASVVEDYIFGVDSIPLSGQAELNGLNTMVTADYQSNPFFPDALTPDASAHSVVIDSDSGYTVGIFSDDASGSFWVVDGRQPNPMADWETMVYNMLDAFGLFGPQVYFWDFEDGLQGWTHTNGQPFPAGWDVEPSGLHADAMSPSPGDSSMWIDSDAAGTSIVINDTAWSPVVVPPANLQWFKWGCGYQNYAGVDTFSVGLREFSSGSWQTPVRLQVYSTDIGPDIWDSVDVSVYASADSIQLFFAYNYGDYTWYASFDNVSLFGPTGHDVGTTAIPVPSGFISPGVALDPQATYENFGGSSETFDVYFMIDSSGTTVYSQTANITLDAGNDTTITWPSWTPGTNDGITYDVIAYTALSGDENPSNDSLTEQATTQSAYWKVYTSTLPAATYYNAVATLDVSGTQMVYSIGGDNAMSAIYEFDCLTETWTTNAATLLTPVQRSAVAAVGGMVYVCAGADASFNALDAMQVFDPVAGTVTALTSVPTAVQFHGAVAWNDTLIYVLGGQSGATYYDLVQIYDPANDAWTSGTPMPSTNRSLACGIFGNYIYVAGGYNGAYISGAWVGEINPGDPTQITWTALPDIPVGISGTPGRSRLQGACDAHGRFYFVGGDDHGTVATDCHYYDPADSLWHQSLDKPTEMSNTQAACFVDPLDGGTFFCAGGYTAGAVGTNVTEGLINLGQYGIAEIPGLIDLRSFGFAALANPVKGVSNIAFTISKQAHVSLKVYDRSGRLVEQLVNRPLPAGTSVVSWNTANVANGVYFLQLDVEGQTDNYKMIVIK
jgi:hypothetical protein